MTAKYLQEPVLEGGIRSVNFFNGRLLTGRDLSREQDARRLGDRRVDQAIGDGIAYGLEVTVSKDSADTAPAVTVQRGLAVNRLGQALYLENATDVLLGGRATPRPGTPRTFGECAEIKQGSCAARPGIYLLTIAPAEDTEGKTLTHALDDAAVPCNTDTVVEAVQFRFVPLDAPLAQELTDRNRLRSRIAYRCFGGDALRSFHADPFGAAGEDYGLLSEIPANSLTVCDVPLAIVSLLKGIDFIDMWSVRRRVTQRPKAGQWGPLMDDRRRAEGEAMFLQFQEQIAAMAHSGGRLRSLKALECLAFLPAAGLLPMPGAKGDDQRAILTFFAGLTVRGPAFIEGARLAPLIRTSFGYPPIDLGSGEVIWLYTVRENRQAIDLKIGPTPAACLVFASGHIPYQADGRFDVAKWDYGNYAIDERP